MSYNFRDALEFVRIITRYTEGVSEMIVQVVSCLVYGHVPRCVTRLENRVLMDAPKPESRCFPRSTLVAIAKQRSWS